MNTRLLDAINRLSDFATIQTGGLKGRSTIDHLSGLENTIRSAFVKREHVISVFFDLEKAYDLTWKYSEMRDLHRM